MSSEAAIVLDGIRGLGSVSEFRREALARHDLGHARKCNSHIHLPPNFSAFETVEQVVNLAAAQDVEVVGVTNYYDYRVYGHFAALARKEWIFPLFGLEIISVVDALRDAGVKINDPGNPGRMYICGKGVTQFDPVPPDAAAILSGIRGNDELRMRAMIVKAGEVFARLGCDLAISEASVKQMIVRRHHCAPELVYIQERHIAQAFQEALFAKVPADERGSLLARAYGAAPKAPVDDAVKMQNEFRASLLRAGKPAFVVESFVSDAEAKRMILAMGGIPCYPTLADGVKPQCPYETPVSALIENILNAGIYMAEFIPVRNTPVVLAEYVRAMRAAGLIVVAGTEHNTLDLIPLEPMCLNSASIPPDVLAIFWEGACVIAAHQFLCLNGEVGYVDKEGALNSHYTSATRRIEAFAKLGATVIDHYKKTTGLNGSL